jgi:hypothetical protein
MLIVWKEDEKCKGVWILVVRKSFLKCTVAQIIGGGFIVRINGLQVKKIYPTLAEAQNVAIRGTIKLLQEVIIELQTT